MKKHTKILSILMTLALCLPFGANIAHAADSKHQNKPTENHSYAEKCTKIGGCIGGAIGLALGCVIAYKIATDSDGAVTYDGYKITHIPNEGWVGVKGGETKRMPDPQYQWGLLESYQRATRGVKAAGSAALGPMIGALIGIYIGKIIGTALDYSLT